MGRRGMAGDKRAAPDLGARLCREDEAGQMKPANSPHWSRPSPNRCSTAPRCRDGFIAQTVLILEPPSIIARRPVSVDSTNRWDAGVIWGNEISH